MALHIAFWVSLALVVYTYLGYPLLMGLLARLLGRNLSAEGPTPSTVSIVLCVRDEAVRIGPRLTELQALLEVAGVQGEIVVVVDGTSPATVAAAREVSEGCVRIVELPKNVGKAEALSRGCAVAQNEILIFADVRQTWPPEAIPELLRPFSDPTVGGVSGDLVLEKAPGVLAGVGLYWKFEKWLRRQESRVYSTVGATGAISAVRRDLFRAIPRGTLLDDVYWPMQVALQGYRVIHHSEARAFDRLPERTRDEFRRKVRTLTGNFQLLGRLPAVLMPGRNPIWLQFFSHKLMRLAAPWCLLLALVSSFFLPGVVYQSLFWAQVVGYAVAGLGLFPAVASRNRVLAAASSFLVLNAASWLAFWVWTTGQEENSWKKVDYRPKDVKTRETVSAS